MRVRILVTSAAVALLTAAGAIVAASGASAAPARTTVIGVRPVTSTGHAAPGYSVKTYSASDEGVDCSFPDPSPGAVDDNIEYCSPSAAYAIACWKAASPGYALCLRNVQSHQLAKIPLLNKKFAKTPRSTERAPLFAVLTNGVKCGLRDGGAGPTLTTHPSLTAVYYCTGGLVGWASESTHHLGVDMSKPLWQLHVAMPGKHTLVSRDIAKAWFVGTKS